MNRITVRDLLRMFRAERRGPNKVNDIRSALNELGLETEPDFESAWIDRRIKIRLKNGAVRPAAVSNVGAQIGDDADDPRESDGESDELDTELGAAGTNPIAPIVASNEGVVETALSEPPDPTFRIGSLPAANKPVTTVGHDDLLTRAVTKMLQFDYSQLPIMRGEREVKGMISWKSIASRYAIGGECNKVRDCREDAQVVDGNGTLFDAIPTIVKYGYVLVRSESNRRITGIVTASDLSLQFQQLAEPFLLLREIELHIRQLLQDKITAQDLQMLGGTDASLPIPKSINDLSFGGYMRLLQDPKFWAKLELNIDQASMTAQLDQVRIIRNDVMHFDPDPLTPHQLETLKNASKFMQQLYELLP